MSFQQLQKDTAAWGQETFGLPKPMELATRMNVEVAELLSGLSNLPATAPGSLDHTELLVSLADECADIGIVLVQVANRLGFDLMTEMVRKMGVNRKRVWAKKSNGQFQHVDIPGATTDAQATRVAAYELIPVRTPVAAGSDFSVTAEELKALVTPAAPAPTSRKPAPAANAVAGKPPAVTASAPTAPAPAAPPANPAEVLRTIAEEVAPVAAPAPVETGPELPVSDRWYILDVAGTVVGPQGGFAESGAAYRWAQGPNGKRAGITDVSIPEFDADKKTWNLEEEPADFIVAMGSDILASREAEAACGEPA